MKSIKFALLGLGMSVAACQSAHKTDQHKKDSISNLASATVQPVDERFLIVAGRSVGEITLGEDMGQVGIKLGRPNAGDAAMGKAWGIWYSDDSTGKHPNEIAIYSSYRDTSMLVKDVKQIRITSNKFKTQDGLSTGRTLEDTKLKFSTIEKLSAYLNEEKDTVLVYDDKKDGIGFEFLKGKSISLTVHPANIPVNATYLTLHPEWKLIK
ncbi:MULTISPECIES: hypothetical protein [unclassified Pedobacter]|uniref:hypothetical protein n=1 Tax=unclassified Pedobacter TaxID=2628915 RepID=UPI00142444B8|nr:MULTISPECIES: hypothetical protein [unclassified Pedobacter]NII81949.1 hypothetical protein [Pedobacter sp. SG908]NMN35953.1 hypothetical protein [Pedobacter sp. SG918]